MGREDRAACTKDAAGLGFRERGGGAGIQPVPGAPAP